MRSSIPRCLKASRNEKDPRLDLCGPWFPTLLNLSGHRGHCGHLTKPPSGLRGDGGSISGGLRVANESVGSVKRAMGGHGGHGGQYLEDIGVGLHNYYGIKYSAQLKGLMGPVTSSHSMRILAWSPWREWTLQVAVCGLLAQALDSSA